MIKHIIYIVTLTIFLTQVLTGCNVYEKANANDEVESNVTKPVAFPVEATYPQRNKISKFFETTSRVSAENKVDVISKGMGICVEICVEEGERVKEGQVLAKLDTSEVETQILQTKVNIEKCKSALAIAEQSLREGIGSKVERDNAKFALDAAEATLKIQQLQLKNQTITAPISGVITRRNINKGVMVSVGMPVFSIVDPDSYCIPISIPEREISKVFHGQEAEVFIDSCPEKKYRTVVDRISPTIDSSSGTVKATLKFVDFNNDLDCIKDYAFSRVKLVMETRENVLTIPKDAVLEESGKKYVFIAERLSSESGENSKTKTESNDDNIYIAKKVEIQVGLEDPMSIEVVSGIDDNTMVITLGQMSLKPGSIIKVTSLEESVNSSSPLSTSLNL
ncbi:MAG: efflux RND transporter periplasmic adaptor subunit [Candidatus Hydrogenedentes bacterium]|nr:efflux RND transporter periplasmic adaptor subunit [Candidatus Hydrogenedentota bacterium]